MPEKAVITCALTGVLTNPKQHPVPVTPEQMAREARRAYNAGASIMHVHYRDQREGMGHLPTWDAAICNEINEAIRAACPEHDPGTLRGEMTGGRLTESAAGSGDDDDFSFDVVVHVLVSWVVDSGVLVSNF